MKRNYSTLEEFESNLHQEGYTVFDYDGQKLPCLFIHPKKYKEILSKTLGKKYVIDSLLDIFFDGQNCFVDVVLKFSDLGIEENYLLDANKSIEFFNSLSDISMIGLLPADPSLSSNVESNIFVIQLPRKDRIEQAIDIIRRNVRSK